MSKEALGIENYGVWYFKLKDDQLPVTEFIKIDKFIGDFINRSDIKQFEGEKEIQFINYGSTQLVYVLTVNGVDKYTLLVNQPATPYGCGRIEYDNLIKLNYKDKRVIEPLYYYANDECELYVTPYIYQSRCIGVDPSFNKFGYWAPEPEYHFVPFTEEENSIVVMCMIAMLIKLYDESEQLAIVETRLDGGDFMLDKGFEDDITVDSVLSHTKLIAARNRIKISLDDYIELMKVELTRQTYKCLVHGKLIKQPISEETIEKGIELGLKLRQEKIRNKK